MHVTNRLMPVEFRLWYGNIDLRLSKDIEMQANTQYTIWCMLCTIWNNSARLLCFLLTEKYIRNRKSTDVLKYPNAIVFVQ